MCPQTSTFYLSCQFDFTFVVMPRGCFQSFGIENTEEKAIIFLQLWFSASCGLRVNN